ncbi:hypothetical protein B0H11DRAFT_2028037 [Mycena galericulata]|nr:hypothetical protein B0H11DRAFT_2028037 [Mycena galericulata]
MGTRGYRSNTACDGTYHVYYNHYDSFPTGLGVQVAAEIPRDPEPYKACRDRLRKQLEEAQIERNKSTDVDDDDDGPTITQKQPQNDIMIEWVYEIDLDHEVFLVDTFPLFALNNMPDSDDSYVRGIGFDSYGCRGYTSSTPDEHRYNWTSAPPPVNDEVVELYAAREPKAEVSIAELLGPASETIGTCEATRIGLYEVLINRTMQFWRVAHGLRVLESLPDRTHISDQMLRVGIGMVQLAVGRMLFGKKDDPALGDDPQEFHWFSPNMCLRITTHLDDERNKKKGILELVDEIASKRQHGSLTYGILFSFFHCVIIQVDEDNGFKSTAAMQFLPSYYTTSPSTAGITAIARLAYHCLPTGSVVNTLPPNHFLNQVPLDVLEHITNCLDVPDLESLRSAAPVFTPAADSLLRFPHIESYRLLGVVPTPPPPSRSGNKALTYSLVSKAFSAMLHGSSVPTFVVSSTGKSAFPLHLGDIKGKVFYGEHR